MTWLRTARRHFRPVHGALLLGTAVTLLVLLVLQGLPFITRAELNAYDFQFQRRGTLPAPANIVVVGVDQPSLDNLAQSVPPLPRRWMASAVNFLHLAHARAIGLDFEYFSPATRFAGMTRQDDLALAAALRRAGNVVLIAKLESAGSSSFVVAGSSLTEPIDALRRAAAGWGVGNVSASTVRAVDVWQAGPGGSQVGGKMYPAFAAVLASVALHQPLAQVLHGLPSQNMYIDYLGPQNPGDESQKTFVSDQFIGLAACEDDSGNFHPRLPSGLCPRGMLGDSPDSFRDKIVLLVPEAISYGDQHSTPFGTMYGGYVEANALNTILKRDPIMPAGNNSNSLIVLIVGLTTTIVASRSNLWRSAGAALAVAVGYVALALILFDQFRVWVHLITPEITIVLAFAGIMGLRFATEERQRRRTSRIFGQYVKPEIVEILVNASDEEKALAGARRTISVLYVDVRGFTHMSEGMQPEDVIKALDVYLEEVTKSVLLYDGTLNKYVGDELVAIWNAPHYHPDHALRAVKAGLDMVARTEEINVQLRSKGLPAIRFGVGINSGDAVVGNMGSSFRKQYDAVGDTMNTGARLCSAAGGNEIIIGEGTYELVADQLEVEETEPLSLKGKSQKMRTYLVLGLKEVAQTAPEPVAAAAT